MLYGLKIATPPTSEPITIAEARRQTGVGDATDFDDDLELIVRAARQYIEGQTSRQLVFAAWDLFLCGFPARRGAIAIPLAPLDNVVEVEYRNLAGNLETLDSADYIVSASREPGFLRPSGGKDWPSTDAHDPEAVRVRFVAGYGDPEDVPPEAKQAILLIVGHWFDHRSAVAAGIVREVPLSAGHLIESLRWGREFEEFHR